jgi:streptogramin lyase
MLARVFRRWQQRVSRKATHPLPERLEDRVLLASSITEFPVHPFVGPSAWISTGPDGRLWYGSSDQFGRMTTSGSVDSINLGSNSPGTLGADGNFWFGAQSSSVTVSDPCLPPFHTGCPLITTDTTYVLRRTNLTDITDFVLGHSRVALSGSTPSFVTFDGGAAGSITNGPDGDIWFLLVPPINVSGAASPTAIERITPDGRIEKFTLPDAVSHNSDLTSGPDGALWITEPGTGRIARMTVTGVVTEFPISSSAGAAQITAGPDGNLWFTEPSVNMIGRMTPTGSVTEFPIPTPNSSATYITGGPDGAVWFTESAANKIGRIAADGTITELPIPTDSSGAAGIVTGPDSNLWFTETTALQIGRIAFPSAGSLSPASDSGASHSDGITNISAPTFAGTATPGTPIRLFVQPVGQSANVLVGQSIADADGSWSITSIPLSDGSYTVNSQAIGPDGSVITRSLPIGVAGRLVIDTAGPRITAASFNPRTDQFRVTFNNDLSGIDPSTLLDPKNYRVTGPHARRGPTYAITGISNASTLPTAVPAVLLQVNNGQAIRHRQLVLRVLSGGIADLAGNALDGEYRHKLPSGNGQSGGDFVARFFAFCRRASRPLPVRPALR